MWPSDTFVVSGVALRGHYLELSTNWSVMREAQIGWCSNQVAVPPARGTRPKSLGALFPVYDLHLSFRGAEQSCRLEITEKVHFLFAGVLVTKSSFAELKTKHEKFLLYADDFRNASVEAFAEVPLHEENEFTKIFYEAIA